MQRSSPDIITYAFREIEERLYEKKLQRQQPQFMPATRQKQNRWQQNANPDET